MPVVRPYPIGEASPQPLPNAQPNVPAAGDLTLFGGNQAQDLQVAGQRLGQASDNVFSIYERKAKEANESRVQDVNNQFITGMQEILRTGPDAFYKLKGGDAVQGAGAATERLAKLREQLLGQAGNEYQRQRLRPILDAHFASSTEQIARHVDQQQQVYDRNVALASQDVAEREAITNPENLPGAMTRAADAARSFHKGQAPEVVENEARKAGSRVASASIKNMIAQNDPAALPLFLKYQGQLDVGDRIELQRQLKTVQTSQDARGYVAWLNARAPDALPPLVENYRSKILEHSKALGVEPALAAGLIAGESGGDTRAISPAGARGLTQLLPGTAADLRVIDPHNPDQAIPGGIKYYKQQLDKFGDERLALMAYNWGPGNVEKWIKAGSNPADVPAETRAYIQKVQGYKKAYADKWDPLREGVNAAVPAPGASQADAAGIPVPGPSTAAGPPGFLDTLQGQIDNEKWHIDATARNQRDNAARPDLLSAAKSLIDIQFESRKAQIALAQHQLDKAVEDWVTKPAADGKPQIEPPPPDIWNKLSYAKQNSVYAALRHNASGQDGVTDWKLWYTILRGLTSDDLVERRKWADTDLWQYKPNLAKQEYRQLADLQGAVRKGDPEKELTRMSAVNKMVDDRLGWMNIKTGPKASVDDQQKEIRFREAVQDRISALERSSPGHKASSEEVKKILNDLTYEVSGTGGWFSSNKRAFEVANPDPSKFVVKMTDIPKSDLDKIAAALKDEGIKPTEENIIKRYKMVRVGPQP